MPCIGGPRQSSHYYMLNDKLSNNDISPSSLSLHILDDVSSKSNIKPEEESFIFGLKSNVIYLELQLAKNKKLINYNKSQQSNQNTDTDGANTQTSGELELDYTNTQTVNTREAIFMVWYQYGSGMSLILLHHRLL